MRRGIQNTFIGYDHAGGYRCRWRRIVARLRAELLEAACAEPRLRQTYPQTGMGELHFGRCTQQRWTWDIPSIQAVAGGVEWVSGPARTQTVHPAATVQEAIAIEPTEISESRLPCRQFEDAGPAS
jgi:hypothetical protein